MRDNALKQTEWTINKEDDEPDAVCNSDGVNWWAALPCFLSSFT